MRRATYVGTTAIVALGLAACGQDTVTAPPVEEAAPEAAFSVFGTGGGRPALLFGGCRGSRHREFDFWLGQWDVFGTDGSQVGTNVVESRVGGCIVQENWTAANGTRGRSLNMFDRDDGQWHQTWVTEGLGHLRMAGGIQPDDHMLLTGQRVSASSGLLLVNTYEWTPIARDSVLQEGKLTVPELDLEFPFSGLYLRTPHVTPAPSSELPGCQEGGVSARSRELDFWLGRWKVRTERGLPLGTAVVEADLSGCLLQEHFESFIGLEALAFVYYDPTVRRWYSTYGDSSGERVELEGDRSGDSIVMTGTEPGLFGRRRLDVRATWTPIDADHVRQTWEVSPAGRDRYVTLVTLVYSRS